MNAKSGADTPKRLTAERLAEIQAAHDRAPLAPNGMRYDGIQGQRSDLLQHIATLTLERDAVTRELTTAVLRAENWTAQAAAVTLERDGLRKALNSIRAVANEQAEDEGLWSVPLFRLLPISEAYLQQGLRKLHHAIDDALKELEKTKEQK